MGSMRGPDGAHLPQCNLPNGVEGCRAPPRVRLSRVAYVCRSFGVAGKIVFDLLPPAEAMSRNLTATRCRAEGCDSVGGDR